MARLGNEKGNVPSVRATTAIVTAVLEAGAESPRYCFTYRGESITDTACPGARIVVALFEVDA